MSPELLQILIQGMQNLQTQAVRNQTVSTPLANLSACKARFDGSTNANVEVFIDSITTYKDCLNIFYEHAVKGLSMLLFDDAATWWQGIKSSITTFEEAIESLRHAYGFAKAPHQIYKELFSSDQGAYTPIKHVSLMSLLPDTEHFMTYEGSTTHPGCWETTVWIILNKPIYITKHEVGHALMLICFGVLPT
ncbi:unnamed protein product [Phaedon cochleariae]|uniref:Alpha-carbonic anhydrase domain-containing protein n=1 Tax=Phaedon cochleariae TaxID=80249 RepID=A0A9N9SEP1_PHACE|nr:unnamed protein product [Phaedon cochleariae]